MDAASRKRLVAEWIDHQTHPLVWDSSMVLRQQELYPQAVETLERLAYDEPELCWGLILEITHTSQANEVMMGASVVLDRLLEEHPQFIERVEATAPRDAQFKELLGWLLPSEPSAELWQRVRRVAGNVEW